MIFDQDFASAIGAAYTPTLLLVAKGTLLLVAALGISTVMSRASAGARHLLWLVTIVTLLLMPAVAAWAPLRVEILPPEAASAVVAPAASMTVLPVAPAANASTPRDVAADASRSTNATPESAARTMASSSSSPLDARARHLRAAGLRAQLSSISPVSLLLLSWGTVAALLLLRLVHATMQVKRIVAQGNDLDGVEWQAPLMEVADRMGLDRAPRLLASSDTNMPFACGVVTPTIVLPAGCNAWSLDRRYAVLLHEVAHIERRDLVGHALGRIACALYWFHPLVWSAAKRLRAESERACDDLALLSGARASDYAEHLLDIISTIRRDKTPAVALAMARRKEFEGRMLAILDPEIRHARPNRRQTIALTATIGAMALVVGAASPAPRRVNAAAHTVAASDSTSAKRALEIPNTPARQEVASPQTAASAAAHSSSSAPQSAPSPAPRAAASPYVRVDTRAQTVTNVETHVNANVSTNVNSNTSVVGGDGSPAARLELMLGNSSPSNATRRAVRQEDERATLLARVLRTDTSASLRRVAAWGLEKYADEPAARDALAAALRRDNNARVREMSAWSLGSGDRGGAATMDALIAALRDEDVHVRATAAWALGSAGYRGAANALVTAIDDTSRAVSARALWAIGNLDLHSAPQPVINALRHNDATMRRLAAWVLYNIEDPAAVPALESAMRNDTRKELQVDYIRALAATGERSVAALSRLLDSSDPAVKSIAVRALAGGQATGPWPWPWPEPRPFP